MSNREPDNVTRKAFPDRLALRSAPMHRALCLALGMMAFSLSASAMAQQKPLTGEMLNGRTPAATAPVKAPATKAPAKPAPVPHEAATTYPTQPTHPAHAKTRVTQTRPAKPAPPTAAVAPVQPPMPDYTDMKTAYIQPPPTTDETRSTPFGTPVGIVTHYLLKMQASNQNAVASLPTLGVEASAAYQRYIQSFNHPIPDFFQTMVKSDSTSSQ